jgi:hypothetical protein
VVEPYQSSVVLPPVNNQVPMSVNTDEVPFWSALLISNF